MQLEMNSLPNQQNSNTTFALVMVVIVFIICHVPMFVVKMLSHVITSQVFTLSDLVLSFVMRDVSYVLTVVNSAVNFVIYILANKRFREVLTKTVCIRHRPTERRVVTARQMPGAEDEFNDTPL